ncbi:MAG: COX15/CtaA family protein [Pseudomonadota bacterium]
MISLYRLLTILLPVLAAVVITVGAYVRLTHAGLGCPDWPGCYGQLFVTENTQYDIEKPHELARPVESGKAWREMFHRYIAASLGLGIIVLFALSFSAAIQPRQTKLLGALVFLVAFQGALGMWTVTLLLKPLVVTAHLFGGLATLSLLFWHLLRHFWSRERQLLRSKGTVRFAGLALIVLIGQIFLGGWTSTNYAALACTDFPSCHGSYWPQMDFVEGFTLWRGLGIDYEYGVLESPARTAIHFSHRLWAMVTALVLIVVAFQAIMRDLPAVKTVVERRKLYDRFR